MHTQFHQGLLAKARNMKLEVNWDALFAAVLEYVDKGLKLGLEYIPHIEIFVLDKLDAMFAPRQILRQAIMIIVIQISLMTYTSLNTVAMNMLSYLTDRGRKMQLLKNQMGVANSFAEWKQYATKVDEMTGNYHWREIDDSPLCDCRMIKKRINSTIDMLQRGDVFDLMFRVRGGLARDMFGIQHEGLFTKAQAGTKLIIEKYHDTMAMALNYICDSSISEEEVIDLPLMFLVYNSNAFVMS